MIFIFNTFKSFHTLIMNFIVDLSNEFDVLLTITNKFFRRVMFIYDKSTYTVANWAQLILNKLQNVDWEILEKIISNKNSKFLSKFWRIVFNRLNISMLINIVYHLQTNESFERINQIVEITLRYLIIMFSNEEWKNFLSSLQTQLNNSLNVVIELSLNEMIYDFKIKKLIFVIENSQSLISKNILSQRLKYQREIANVTVFVNAKTKIYYDSRHQSIFFRFDDRVYLRLHQKYQLSNRSNKKMFNQKCELFIVKRRVDRLTYELKLSAHWRIYSIIFVTQLKFYLDDDFYHKFRSNYSNFVKMKENTNDWRFYVIEKILNKKIKKFERIVVIQYMIKWFDWKSKYNEWRFFFFWITAWS